MPMLHEYSPIRRSRNWTIMNVQSVLKPKTTKVPDRMQIGQEVLRKLVIGYILVGCD